jgi:hypothetical protein
VACSRGSPIASAAGAPRSDFFHPRLLQEDGMSKPTKAAQGSAAAAPAPKKFEQMTTKEKTTHVLKVVLFFVTFGFAFANILRDD